MPTKRLSRRTVLRGALATGAAVSVPLPILDIMLNNNGTAFAQGAPLPKRYCTWFFGNGIIPALWNPSATGTGSAWGLTEELAPLMPVKQWLTVVSGLKNMIGNASPHPMGSAASTTGGERREQLGRAGIDRPDRGGREQGGQLPLLGDWLQRRHPQRPGKHVAYLLAPRPQRPELPGVRPPRGLHPHVHGCIEHRHRRSDGEAQSGQEEHPRRRSRRRHGGWLRCSGRRTSRACPITSMRSARSRRDWRR